ncbi:MAG TPA: DivIVA domain-containing protein [Nitrospiria bacterium]|nr:DivIVA domain-containing protein [Nitrospiria bacterium]
MKLTPLDIRQAVFGLTLRGYDRKEVDLFMEALAQEFETMIKENNELRERMVAMEGSLNELKKKEGALTSTLISAQKAIDEMKSTAQKEGELIIKEAELKAEELSRSASAEVSRLQREIFDLKRQRDQFIEKLRAYIQGFERALTWEDKEEVVHRMEKDQG